MKITIFMTALICLLAGSNLRAESESVVDEVMHNVSESDSSTPSLRLPGIRGGSSNETGSLSSAWNTSTVSQSNTKIGWNEAFPTYHSNRFGHNSFR